MRSNCLTEVCDIFIGKTSDESNNIMYLSVFMRKINVVSSDETFSLTTYLYDNIEKYP